MRERPRAHSTPGKAVEVASVVDVVEVAQEAVAVVADAEHLHTEFQEGMEASPICQWPTSGICTTNRSTGECPFPI